MDPTKIELADVARIIGEREIAFMQARKAYEAEIARLQAEVQAALKDKRRGPRAVEATGGDA